MSRSINFSIGEYYHLYNRGVEKRKIFLNQKDYQRFVALLYLANSQQPVHVSIQGKSLEALLSVERGSVLVDIGAYCLMPNHFHLLVRERLADGISRFMQKAGTAYTMYFNKKNERAGALLQGVFKATHANRDEYLKYLYAYIHLNPVKLIEPAWKEARIKHKQKAIAFLKKYRYSSYVDFVGGERIENNILNPKAFPEYFENDSKDFDTLINSWISFKAKP